MSSSRLISAWCLLFAGLSVAPSALVLADELQGEQRVEKRVGGHLIVVTARLRAVQQCDNPGSWVWGVDQECPHQAIVGLKVARDADTVFVPASAYMDLAGVRSLAIEPAGQGFRLVILGGDASTSYRATLAFGREARQGASVLQRRTVRSGEFPDDVWEETRYSFRSGLEPEPPIRP